MRWSEASALGEGEGEKPGILPGGLLRRKVQNYKYKIRYKGGWYKKDNPSKEQILKT